MELIDKLPAKKGIIGEKEIVKSIKAGKVKRVIVAKNCPDFLIEKIRKEVGVEIQVFNGDRKELGTKLGKPFFVSVVGYE